MATVSVCKISGCDKPAIARGQCGKHYQQWRKAVPADAVARHARAGEPMAWIAERAGYQGDDCCLWPFAKYPSGYGMLNLPAGGATMASRFMCERVHGPPSADGMQAAHTCGNGSSGCMTPGHLYWGTRAQNEADKIEHGTSNRGAQNGHAKLKKDAVLAIRKSTDGPAVLARRYDISAGTVCDIQKRRSWAWLPD